MTTPIFERHIMHVINATTGYLDLGMPQEAKEELHTLSPQLKQHPTVLPLRIQVALALGQLTEAQKLVNVGLHAFPERAEFYFLKASILQKIGRPRDAKQILLTIPAVFHHTDSFHLNLARFEAELGNKNAARSHLQKALQLNKNLGTVILNDPQFQIIRGALSELIDYPLSNS